MSRHPVFKSLRLWFDIYRDGASQPLELWPLRLLGIRSLSGTTAELALRR